MIIPLVVGAGAAVAGLLGYAATRPDSFRVQRATHIDAPPDRVFEKISDFHQFVTWSPWEDLDPAMNKTISGAARGKGAVYEWNGNKKVGKGRMEITEAVPPEKVVIKLDFFQPFEAHNITEMSLTPRDGGTAVVWSMTGSNPFMMKVMGIFMNMDRMIGKDFEKGLARLKAQSEGGG